MAYQEIVHEDGRRTFEFIPRPSKSQGGDGMVSVSGPLKAAGRFTADTSNQFISVASGFNSIAVKNEGATELIISIDSPIETSTKKLFISPGEPYSRSIKGTTFYYGTASGSTTFKLDIVG